MSEKNKATAATFLKALGAGDIAALRAVVTDDVVAVTAGYSAVSGPRDRDLILRICAAMPQIMENGIEFEILNMTAEADRVAAEVQGHAKTIGGKRYDNQYHFLFHFRDGKICLLKEYLDNQLADTVLGPYLAAAQ